MRWNCKDREKDANQAYWISITISYSFEKVNKTGFSWKPSQELLLGLAFQNHRRSFPIRICFRDSFLGSPLLYLAVKCAISGFEVLFYLKQSLELTTCWTGKRMAPFADALFLLFGMTLIVRVTEHSGKSGPTFLGPVNLSTPWHLLPGATLPCLWVGQNSSSRVLKKWLKSISFEVRKT